MAEITVLMALMDFIPVLLFFAASIILMRDLYNKLSKAVFAMLAAGSLMVFFGGFYKALWKLLYGAGIADVPYFDSSLFPFQAPGFLLMFAALITLFLNHKNKSSTVVMASAVPVYASKLPLIILQVIGASGVYWAVFAIAVRMRQKLAMLLLALGFIAMLGMGYLGSSGGTGIDWIEQTVNLLSQGFFLLAVWLLSRAGLSRPNSLVKKETPPIKGVSFAF